jgi:FAD/FMN-containing dehydrogenase
MRGCGTSLSGETVNAAVIIDTSKYMREIIEVDPDRRIARVQPGVVRDQLRDWVVMAAGPSADSRGGA